MNWFQTKETTEQEEELTALRVIESEKPNTDQFKMTNVDQYGLQMHDNNSDNSGKMAANPRKINVSPIVHVHDVRANVTNLSAESSIEQSTSKASKAKQEQEALLDVDLHSPSTSKENPDISIVCISNMWETASQKMFSTQNQFCCFKIKLTKIPFDMMGLSRKKNFLCRKAKLKWITE